MAQLKVSTTLVGKLSFQDPCEQVGLLTTTCNANSGRSDALFWPIRAMHSHAYIVLHTHILNDNEMNL